MTKTEKAIIKAAYAWWEERYWEVAKHWGRPGAIFMTRDKLIGAVLADRRSKRKAGGKE